MFIHFANLNADMPREMRCIASFLDIPINATKWDAILEHCSFDYLKANATPSVPLGGAFWDCGAQTFVHKGINGCLHDTLTEEECAVYEQRSISDLGSECAEWLITGNVQ